MTREAAIAERIVKAGSGWGWTIDESSMNVLKLTLSYIGGGTLMVDEIGKLKTALNTQASRDMTSARDAGLPLRNGTMSIGPARITILGGNRLSFEAEVTAQYADAEKRYTISDVESVFNKAGINMD